MIERSVVDNVIETANSRIVDIIQDFVPLKKRGANYLGLCPFHTEKTGSFHVSAGKGIFKCFGCGMAGNAVKFVMEHEHYDFADAIKYLGAKLGIHVPEKQMSAEELQVQSDRESMMALNDFARQHFIDNLWQSDEGISVALPYFRERGFRDDVIRKFDLGYALSGRTKFLETALARGFKTEYLTKTGLATFGENNYRADRFFGRVIFPIHNLSGKVIAFGGRVMTKSDKVAKYLNSPESELYHKSDIVYGLYHARHQIVRDDMCYLVEGYTDVLSMHQAGLTNVVASCGTSLTENQIRLIKRFTQNITVLYDGDAAGIKASMRGIDMILEQGVSVHVVALPDGEDPDSFARSHSAEECRQFIAENQTDFIHFKVKLLMADAATDPTRRAGLINSIVESISKVQDKVLRDVYVQDCSRLMSISQETLFGVLRDTLVKTSATRREDTLRREQEREYDQAREASERAYVQQQSEGEKRVVTKSVNPFEYEENELLRLFIKYVDRKITVVQDDGREVDMPVADYIVSQLEKEKERFSSVDPTFNKIMQCYIDANKYVGLTPMIFVNQTDTDISSRAATLLASDTEESKYHRRYREVLDEAQMLHELVPRAINEIRFKIIKRTIEDFTRQLNALENSGADEAQITDLLTLIGKWNQLKAYYSRKLGDRSVL